MTDRKTRIYLSGPITGTKDYKSRFKWYQRQLEAQGHEVVNPAEINSGLPDTTTHAQYMAVSFALLDICDAIYIMPRSNESAGVKMEIEHAFFKGLLNISKLVHVPEYKLEV